MNETNRIDTRFASLKAANKKAFIPFLTAGFPNLELFAQILEGLPGAGADLIEIGMPFSDPMADGPSIQAANLRAFKAGIKTTKILEFVRAFRKKDQETPIILMGYYNPLYSYGIMRFLDDAQKAGVDGFIVPDLPPEEDLELREPCEKRELRLIRLITPTTDDERLTKILDRANGFLYNVSVAGITGSKSAHAADLKTHIEHIRTRSPLPVCIGFGVGTPEQAHEMATISDGVIVGSAILNHIARSIDVMDQIAPDTVASALAFVRTLADGAHQG